MVSRVLERDGGCLPTVIAADGGRGRLSTLDVGRRPTKESVEPMLLTDSAYDKLDDVEDVDPFRSRSGPKVCHVGSGGGPFSRNAGDLGTDWMGKAGVAGVSGGFSNSSRARR